MEMRGVGQKVFAVVREEHKCLRTEKEIKK